MLAACVAVGWSTVVSLEEQDLGSTVIQPHIPLLGPNRDVALTCFEKIKLLLSGQPQQIAVCRLVVER